MGNDNAYMREYMALRYEHRRAAAIEQLGGKCVKCDSIENLQFDHINAKTKSFTIAKKMAGIAEDKLQAELTKCQLLCFPCHLSKTRKNKENPGPRRKIMVWNHGSGTAYFREKCRCESCVRFRRLYRIKKIDYHGHLI